MSVANDGERAALTGCSAEVWWQKIRHAGRVPLLHQLRHRARVTDRPTVSLTWKERKNLLLLLNSLIIRFDPLPRQAFLLDEP